MDIISSLATLSFDKRRSDFFTKELLILLRLIDNGVINKNILFGSGQSWKFSTYTRKQEIMQ